MRRPGLKGSEIVYAGLFVGTLRLAEGDSQCRLWMDSGGVTREILQRIATMPVSVRGNPFG